MEKTLSNTQSNEQWRTVYNYPNYMVSNLGRVMSVERKTECSYKGSKYVKTIKSTLLVPISMNNGYLAVHIFNDKGAKMKTIHRLVAEAFLFNPLELNEVDHINRDKSDNRAENLRWCTHKQNMNNIDWDSKDFKNMKEVIITESTGEKKTFKSIAQAARHYNTTMSKIKLKAMGRKSKVPEIITAAFMPSLDNAEVRS